MSEPTDTPEGVETQSLADIQFMRVGRNEILFRFVASNGQTMTGNMTEDALDLLLNRAVDAKQSRVMTRKLWQ